MAARFWFAAILVGVIGYAASFLLYNYAIARVRAAPASIIVTLIPVFGLASAVCWLGDSLTAGRIFGAILIGMSVTIFTAIELGEVRRAAKAAERDAAGTPAPQPWPSAGVHLIAADQWPVPRPSWAADSAKIGSACPCAVCARLPNLAFSAPVPVGRRR